MRIVSLQIKNLRAVSDLRLMPGREINWIVGRNGAGKTSLLEAIFILARGKSFRSLRHGPLIHNMAKELRILSSVESHGVSRVFEFVSVSGRSRLFDDKSIVRRVRDIGAKLHVRIVTENSQRLLEGNPDVRRMFLDWNLFHVEHLYADLLGDFRRVLAQRNAWLKCGGAGFPVWDAEYVSLSEQITALRRAFVTRLDAEIGSLDVAALEIRKLNIGLNKGWPDGRALADVLTESLPSDTRRGFTRYGPGRGDLEIQFGDLPGIGSRGQSKLAAILLQLGAQKVLETRRDASCIWLLDDLQSELDSKRFDVVCRLFSETSQQIFITSLENPKRKSRPLPVKDAQTFHVEHGSLIGHSTLCSRDMVSA